MRIGAISIDNRFIYAYYNQTEDKLCQDHTKKNLSTYSFPMLGEINLTLASTIDVSRRIQPRRKGSLSRDFIESNPSWC